MSQNNIPIASDHILDVCGLFCPEPVMMLHNKIRDVAEGEVIAIWATDPATTRDIPKFCAFLGHQLLLQEERDGKYLYLLEKCSS